MCVCPPPVAFILPSNIQWFLGEYKYVYMYTQTNAIAVYDCGPLCQDSLCSKDSFVSLWYREMKQSGLDRAAVKCVVNKLEDIEQVGLGWI